MGKTFENRKVGSNVNPADDELQAPFCSTYRNALTRFVDGINASNPEIIVAISRKGPRLLQLIDRHPFLGRIQCRNIVTERALPFMRPNQLSEARITVVDDTLIWGSTFHDVTSHLRDHNNSFSQQVVYRSATANRTSGSLVQAAEVASSQSVYQFVESEVRAFALLGGPYDLDHPVINVNAESAPYLLRALRFAASSTQETTLPWQASSDLRVHTLDAEQWMVRNNPLQKYQYGPVKLRIFYRERQSSISVVPIYCLALRQQQLLDASLFKSYGVSLSEVWQAAQTRVIESSSNEDTIYSSLAQVAHYIASLRLYSDWISASGDADLVLDAAIDSSSILQGFGTEIGGALNDSASHQLADLEFLSSHQRSNVFTNESVGIRSSTLDSSREVFNLNATRSGRQFTARARDLMSQFSGADPDECATLIMRAQRMIYDFNTREEGKIQPGRLQVGIPFAVIKHLVESTGRLFSRSQFSAWTDRAIDSGSLVARYGRSYQDPNTWVRTVRFGEVGETNLHHWTAYVVEQAAKASKPGNTEVNSLLIEKLFVILFLVHSSLLDDQMERRLRRGYHTFGARMVVEGTTRETFLLEWMLSRGIIQKGGGHNASSLPISVRPRWRINVSTENACSKQLLVQTSTTIEAIVGIHQRLSSPDAAAFLLALSTCNDEDSLLEAVRTELGLWLEHEKYGIDRVLAMLRDVHDGLDSDDPFEDLKRVARLLGRSANFMRECRYKIGVFEAREATVAKCDRVVQNQFKSVSLKACWDQELRPLVSIERAKHPDHLRYLGAAALVAGKVISIARSAVGLLIAGAPSSDERLERQYEELSSMLAIGGSAFPYMKLPVPPLESMTRGSQADQIQSLIGLLDSCQARVWDSLRLWSPAKPDSQRRFASRDYAVVAFDIRDSSRRDQEEYQSILSQVNTLIDTKVRERSGHSQPLTFGDAKIFAVGTVVDAVDVFSLCAAYLRSNGFLVRGGLYWTGGRQRLVQISDDKYFTGEPLQAVTHLAHALRPHTLIDEKRAGDLTGLTELSQALASSSYLVVENGAFTHWPDDGGNLQYVDMVTGIDLRIRNDELFDARVYVLAD